MKIMKKKRMSIRDWEVVENTISVANQEEEYNQRMLDNALQTMESVEHKVTERIKKEIQKWKKKKLIMDDEIAMHETIANQVSISEQEDAYAALEAKYNNVEEAVEQDLLRAQFDRVDEDFEGQDMLAAQLDGVEDIAESGSGFVEEFEDNVIEENYIEEDDSDGWGSIDDNPYYNDNLDMDQQSPEFWDNL